MRKKTGFIMPRTGSTKGYALLEHLVHYGIPRDSTPYNMVGQTSYPYRILAILLRQPRRVNSTGTLKKKATTGSFHIPFISSFAVIHSYITYSEEKEQLIRPRTNQPIQYPSRDLLSQAEISIRPQETTDSAAPPLLTLPRLPTSHVYCVIRRLGAYLLSFASQAHFSSARANFSSVFCHLARLAVVSISLAIPNKVQHTRNRRLVTMELPMTMREHFRRQL